MLELMDVVDKNDQVITQAFRKEIYTRSLCHRIVHVLIFNDSGEMALQLRGQTLSFCPDHWSTAVGGHVQTGETYEQAAQRECQEELGINCELEFFNKDYYTAPGTPEKFLAIYRTKINSLPAPNPDEVVKVEYFPINKIKNMIKSEEKFHPELLFIIKKYF